MPPRIRGSSCQPQQLLQFIDTATPSTLLQARPAAARALPPRSCSSSGCSRSFSTTPAPQEITMRRETTYRKKFKQWLDEHAEMFKNPTLQNRGPAYLGQPVRSDEDDKSPTADVPFPLNPTFRSEPVLAEGARERIWEEVMVKGLPLKAVSAQFKVDVRRVAAVVRMKEIEKRWERENKPLAREYARQIQRMLPRSHLNADEPAFEPINDLHVHSYTMQQLFVPTSESREFTRADAAKAFGDHILPPDERMRIPELVQMERRVLEGVPVAEASEEFVQAAARSEKELADRQRARAQAAEDRRVRVDTGRFEFRFEKINAEDVGRTGRARHAVGWRYGVPLTDRKRGEVKIPTSVG